MENENTNLKVKLELIFSSALEEDFTEEFQKIGIGKFYTKIPNIMGSGYNNPHLGDNIWPQLNTMLIIYCSEEEAEKIKQIVFKLRKLYETEGIACFESKGLEI